ncbi:13277_t:CDS:2 [Funneliformis geosporum]|nr:13277_t:CDS:2 [Funneliformis geosporum]
MSISSVAKGRVLEEEALKFLRRLEIECDTRINELKALRGHIIFNVNVTSLVLDDDDAMILIIIYQLSRGPGDKGIDIKGVILGIPFVIQCRPVINELEGILIRQRRDTIGVVVGHSRNNFTPSAIETAKTSIYDIILTDKTNLCKDLLDVVAE